MSGVNRWIQSRIRRQLGGRCRIRSQGRLRPSASAHHGSRTRAPSATRSPWYQDSRDRHRARTGPSPGGREKPPRGGQVPVRIVRVRGGSAPDQVARNLDIAPAGRPEHCRAPAPVRRVHVGAALDEHAREIGMAAPHGAQEGDQPRGPAVLGSAPELRSARAAGRSPADAASRRRASADPEKASTPFTCRARTLPPLRELREQILERLAAQAD